MDFTNITRDDPDSLYREALIMRGVSCKLTRELGVFKLLAAFADPLMSADDKSEMVRGIDEGVSPLFGNSEPGSEETEEVQKESMEDYFHRIIKANAG